MVYFSSCKGVKTIGKNLSSIWITGIIHIAIVYGQHKPNIWRHIHISLRTGITVLKTAAGSWVSISKSCSVITEKMYL